MVDFGFEKLDVYQRSLRLSENVCEISSNIDFKYSRVRDQFIGAIISIPLNIAEGNGRSTTKDKINFYKFARASAFECIPIIDICLSLGLIDKINRNNFRSEIFEICKMISGLIRYQKEK